MPPDDHQPDPIAADRDRLRYELATPLTVITARAQLIQRHLLRATGLKDAERDQMLNNLAALLTEVTILSTRIETVIDPDAGPSGTPAPPIITTQPPEAPR